MDDIDKKILRVIQRDGSRSTAQIGEEVDLTSMPVWRRIQKLAQRGIIRKTVTLLDREVADFPILAFVMLRTNHHDKKWFAKLSKFVSKEPAVVEFHRMSGQVDFLLKVMLRDMGDYKKFYGRMINEIDLMDVSTSFAFETLKETTELPL